MRPRLSGKEFVIEGYRMKKIWTNLRLYKKECVLAPLFKMLEASFELMVPLVVGHMVDEGIRNADGGLVWRLALLLLCFALVGLACSLTAQFFAARAAVGFSAKVRSSLFAHIQRLSFAELDKTGTSTLITRLTSDIGQVQNGVNLVLRLFLRSPFIVFGAMIMAFTIDVQAALIFAVAIPLLSIAVFGIMLITMPLYRRVQEKLDQVLLRTRENLQGVRVLRAFNKEKSETEGFIGDHGRLTGLQLFVGRISGAMNPLTYVIINAATLILLWTGAIKVDSGVLTQGQLIALINYMSQILVELVKLANLIITVTKAAACANRIDAVLRMEPGQTFPDGSAAPEASPAEAAVSFRHAAIAYHKGAQEALSGVDLEVRRGETIGVIGGTGSGKSTLVNLIPRFYDVTEGSVAVEGVDVKEYPETVLRRMIGVVPQKAVLFRGTVAENLRFGNEQATDEELWQALSTAQAEDFVREKPDGLDTMIEQNGRNLSGGQRQRLTIARALVTHPRILILDDSASALDYATDARLRRSLRELDGRMTVFVVSQRVSSVQNADRIVVLDDGRVTGIGTHEELLRRCMVYREIYVSQFPENRDSLPAPETGADRSGAPFSFGEEVTGNA